MKFTKKSATAAALSIVCIALTSTPVFAGGRMRVTASGTDASGCGTFSAPCRQISYALAHMVAPGAEIIVGPGSYSTFTVTQAASVFNDGSGTVSIEQGTTGKNAITVNAGTTDTVTLVGLSLNGNKKGDNGIYVTSAGSIVLRNCDARNFAVAGINILPNFNGKFRTEISHSAVANNGRYGVNIYPTSAMLSGVITDLTATDNGDTGIMASNASGFGFQLIVADSTLVGNGNTPYSSYPIAAGLAAVHYASLRVSNNLISGNTVGFYADSTASAYSYANNRIFGNTTDVTGTLTTTSGR